MGQPNSIRLGVCLCFKDSAAFLAEWLLFHFVQGFRRFYLYDNESSDDWRRVAQPWIERGLAETISFPGRGVQAAIYNDCLERASGGVDWLAFLDDDEFLFPVGPEPLDTILSGYEAFAGVAVSWVMFGSDGQETASPQWVIERFPRSSGLADSHVKCIVRPARVMGSKVVGHMFHPVPGFQIVDEDRRPLTEALNPSPSAARLRINHYAIKSWEEWRRRRVRPRADNGQTDTVPEATWREIDRALAISDDPGAHRFLPAMRRLRDDFESRR